MDEGHYNRIKVVLAEKRMTNKKLAQALAITVQTVSRWCTIRKRLREGEDLYLKKIG